LRESIQALQAASTELDTEKAEAELKLRKVLRTLKKRRAHDRKIRRKVRKGICKLKKLFGKECHAKKFKDETHKQELGYVSDFCLTLSGLLIIVQLPQREAPEGY
jgi:N-acetylated-alpha-linked acidic dipeptidase